MTGHLLGWTLAVLGAGVAVGNLVRIRLVSGRARFEAGTEVVMGGGMAVMAAPPTAALYGTYGMWWATVFAVLCLVGVALSLRHAARNGARHLGHAAHVVIGSAAMVLMTLAMPGAASGPTLALAGSSGHGHGGTAGTEAMSAGHGVTGAASGSALLWSVAFWALAAYFVVFVALAVRARMRDSGGPSAPVAAKPRHRRATRVPALFCVPNARLAGHVGMGGSMATMLMMMAA
ncbi:MULTISPECIES: DUF5134 domain-containing protein [Streptomyces]|uniref:DUF5134 domain-containing protein n=1 Tax=Streptomyces stelliscabiei TaxID=146820 RepID=A0A8I0PF47_9ACTN|nr:MULTISPECIES: DUF5134 domain-containing protein [Streptomyces]MBE1602409.1 hypothetical protein [Streptomyces stelliscabiei]MDX2516634.1 DUF5134 domain-containing protein [Streptomyces stelliscabiei]MDX2550379.1 DUF5134 domain-containing protein [Streptomyces stelliscabiei]MDX2610077.1 DUF5134 domain-containing protein [Streptomyces stelliscabiei]MDX2635001.1 DUF5134 domain-containing protein [Streptomyces stelliscabiei]